MSDDHENRIGLVQSRSLRLALSNTLQFIIYFPFIYPIFNLEDYFQHYIIFPILFMVLLIIDLYFTYDFLKSLSTSLNKKLYPLPVYFYVGLSLVTRLSLVYFLIFSVNILQLQLYLIAGTSVLYGLNLFIITDGVRFYHYDKLRVIMWANLTAISVLLGERFIIIFSGMKLLLPLPAAFVLVLLGFDFDGPQEIEKPGLEEDEADSTLFMDFENDEDDGGNDNQDEIKESDG